MQCNFGSGDSSVANALMFLVLRNLIFVDSADRLTLFPVPDASWFNTGKEFQIENAPTRFGSLSMQVISTTSEVQIHFNEIPKYIPPDILINFPFKTKVVANDDFIVKKQYGNSIVINGWPEQIRFLKK